VAVYTTGLIREYVGMYAKGGTAPGNNADAGTRAVWTDLTGNANGALDNGAGTWLWDTTCGWKGAGTVADPYCLISTGEPYVTCGDSSVGEDKTATLEVWVNYSSNGSTWHAFIAEGAGTGTNPEFDICMADDTIQAEVWDNANTQAVAPTSYYYPPTGWNHWVAVMDGTYIRLYKNGTEVGSGTSLAAISTTTLTSLCLFGSKGGQDSPWKHFAGSIATARVYNVGLSAAQVAANYAAGVLGVGTSVGGPPAWSGLIVTHPLQG
jgi:hypothetical protein